MWFNVQQFDEPYRIKFEVNNGKLWQPFFSKSNLKVPGTVQPELLNYMKTNQKHVNELESSIDTKLREKLQKWRSSRRTRFNAYASSQLKRVLENLEKEHNLKLQNQNESEQLLDIQKSYKISGFPINMPFTNMDQIFEAVYATQVHAIPSNDVDFALAVYIYPYPNTILSVWIYIAVLTKRD